MAPGEIAKRGSGCREENGGCSSKEGSEEHRNGDSKLLGSAFETCRRVRTQRTIPQSSGDDDERTNEQTNKKKEKKSKFSAIPFHIVFACWEGNCNNLTLNINSKFSFFFYHKEIN